MEFTYEGKSYPFDFNDIDVNEAIMLQQETGLRPVELLQDFREAGAIGLKAVLLVAVRRGGVDVTWGSLNFKFTDIHVAFGDVEEAPDPSVASTRAPSGKRRSDTGAPSRKK